MGSNYTTNEGTKVDKMTADQLFDIEGYTIITKTPSFIRYKQKGFFRDYVIFYFKTGKYTSTAYFTSCYLHKAITQKLIELGWTYDGDL